MSTSDLFAIWLMPATHQSALLQAIIDLISNRLGSSRFPPHMTVVSGLNRNSIESFYGDDFHIMSSIMTVEGIGIEQEYFRSLYLKLENNDSLISFRSQLLTKFSMEEKSYCPHISLLYGDYSQAQKEKLVSLIEKLVPTFIEFNRVQLWQVDGEVHRWQMRKDFPLITA